MILLNERPISLEYHKELNPLLFNGTKLKPDVRRKLLKFAKEWIKFAHVPSQLIRDITATGSNFNYNYNKYSDIDVHVIIDFNVAPTDYFDDKKKIWTLQHHITLLGIPVEPYVQDQKERMPKEQGVYSLSHNKWVQEPTNQFDTFKYSPYIEKKADFYQDLVEDMIKGKVRIADLTKLRKKFKDMRSKGLAKDGEFSVQNQLFKELRNRGVFARMNAYMSTAYDKDLSD